MKHKELKNKEFWTKLKKSLNNGGQFRFAIEPLWKKDLKQLDPNKFKVLFEVWDDPHDDQEFSCPIEIYKDYCAEFAEYYDKNEWVDNTLKSIADLDFSYDKLSEENVEPMALFWSIFSSSLPTGLYEHEQLVDFSASIKEKGSHKQSCKALSQEIEGLSKEHYNSLPKTIRDRFDLLKLSLREYASEK